MFITDFAASISALPEYIFKYALHLLKVIVFFVVMDLMQMHRWYFAKSLVLLELTLSFFDWDVSRSVRRGLHVVKRLDYHDCAQLMVEILRRTKTKQTQVIIEAAAQVFCNMERSTSLLDEIYCNMESFKAEVILLCCITTTLCERGWRRAFVCVNDVRKRVEPLMRASPEQSFDTHQVLSSMPGKLRPTDGCSDVVGQTLNRIHAFMRVLVDENYQDPDSWDSVAELIIHLHQSHIECFSFAVYADVFVHLSIVAQGVQSARVENARRLMHFIDPTRSKHVLKPMP
jgi:hypothetical protein